MENAESFKQLLVLGGAFVLISLFGFYLAYLYGRKTKQFRWREYGAIMIWPILGVLAFAYFIDAKVLVLFFLSSVAGLALEYLLGFTYHKTLNRRLWKYERFSIKQYTSLLSFPMWGIAGVVFWFVSKIIGL